MTLRRRKLLTTALSGLGVAASFPESLWAQSSFARGIPVRLWSRVARLTTFELAAPFRLNSQFFPQGQWRAALVQQHLQVTQGHETFEFALPCQLSGGMIRVSPSTPRRYRGSVQIHRDPRHPDQLRLINWVDLEDYLLSVVPGEMPPTWPANSLQVQALLARTRASLYRQPRSIHPSRYLVDSTADQYYGGMGHEHPRSSQAVRATAGQIVTYRQRPIESLFHSTCGGHTSANQDIFAPPFQPYLQGVVCDGCQGSPFYALRTVTLSRFQLQSIWGTAAIRILQSDPWGRPLQVQVGSEHWSGQRFWLHLGSRVGWGLLPGNRYDWLTTDQGATIRTQGAGHGVGLCQWGSRGLALAGRSPAAILRHYFPGTEIHARS